MFSGRNIFVVAACMATSFLPVQAEVDSYPSKSVTVVVGFSPGGSGDNVARLVSEELADALKQSFVIQNRAGASGAIAAESVARANPDGYTLMSAGATELAGNLFAIPNLRYDPVKDFVPVIQYSLQPNVLVVRPDNTAVTGTNLEELVSRAKAHPDRLSYGTAGPGSVQEMSMRLLLALSGTKAVQVPYKGGSAALVDLLGGRLDMIFSPVPEVLPYIRSGKLLPIAVSSKKRSPAIPDVPTMHEAGMPGYEFVSWHALVAPAGTSGKIVNQLNQVLQVALEGKLGERLKAMGLIPTGGTPQDAVERQLKSIKTYEEIINTGKNQ